MIKAVVLALATLLVTLEGAQAHSGGFQTTQRQVNRVFHPVEHFTVRQLTKNAVHVDVRAGEHVFVSHDLTRARNLYGKNSKIRMAVGNGEVDIPLENRHAKYTFKATHEFGWFTCSYVPEENIQSIIVRNGTRSVHVGHRSRFLKDHDVRQLSVVPDSEYWIEILSVHDTALHGDLSKYASEETEARHLSSDDEDITGCTAMSVPDDVIAKSADLVDLAIVPGINNRTLSDMGTSGYTLRNLARAPKYPKVASADLDEIPTSGRRLTDAYAFTPDCYDDDDRVHEILVNIVSDVAFYDTVGGTNASALAAFEEAFSESSSIYEIQMNMMLVISNVWMGTDGTIPSSWPAFISYTDDDGCPGDVDTQLNTVTSWVQDLDDDDQAASTHYFSGCSSSDSTIGVAWVGVLCNNNYNTGLSLYTSNLFRVFAHELGHNFGAQHSFENGVGTTGGIMDYGNGKILGTNLYRFRLARRDEMCAEIQDAVDDSCEYISIYDDGTGCGNLVIDDDEECECVDGSKSCSGCKACVLTKDVSCSTSTYYMVPEGATASYGILSDEECCVDGELLDATTTCTGGYCGSGGLCVNPCNSSGLDTCGYSNQGCRLKCTDGDTCSAYWRSGSTYIGNQADGTYCLTSSGTHGECSSGSCVDSGDPTAKPTSSPTASTPSPTGFPTPFPTTPSPTSKPSGFPTAFPTPYPTASPTAYPTSFPTASPTPNPTSTKSLTFPSKKLCKNNKKCKITTAGVARYGYNDAYAFYYFDDATTFKCNSGTFGFDPRPNKKKFCWFVETTLSFSKLTSDGGSGTVKAAGIVRYGADDEYVFKTYDSKTTITCDSSEFNDVEPDTDATKYCYVAYF